MSHVPPDCGQSATPADKAEALYQNYLAGGPDAAYASLKKDYDASSGMCNRDQYFQQVATDLQASGHMPNIAVGWLKAEKDQLDPGHSGVINKRDVAEAEVNGGLDAIFGKVILSSVPSPGDNKTFFDQIAHTKRAWTDSPDGIEDADLRKYSRQMHRAERHTYNQEETARAAEPLLSNHAELLKALDIGRNGESNGFISRHEMKTFLKDYKSHPNEGIYTAQNAEYVNELLHGNVARVSNHPFHGFGVDRLERRAGAPGNLEDDQPTPLAPPPTTDVQPPKAPDVAPPEAADKAADKSNCDVPVVPEKKPAAPKAPDHPDVCLDLEVRKTIDILSRVQPGEGYNAVAARLLDIHPGQHRTPEQTKDITELGREIQKINGAYSTYRLHTDVVLPVSANLELLMKESPALAASLQKMRDKIAQPPQTTAEVGLDD
jgi:hypothetical protein